MNKWILSSRLVDSECNFVEDPLKQQHTWKGQGETIPHRRDQDPFHTLVLPDQLQYPAEKNL